MSVESVRPEDLHVNLGAILGALLARWLRLLLVTALLVAATWTGLLFLPKMYASTAGLLVEQRSSEEAREPSIPVEAMMSSQIELIRSRNTLMSVIDNENLRSEPEFTGAGFSVTGAAMRLLGRAPERSGVDEQVLQNLYERLKVVRERDSAVISITVETSDPDLSARVANAIADAHVRRRAELSLSDTAATSSWLQQEIERLRVKVREAEAAVAEYRVQNGLLSGPNGTSIGDQQLSAITAQISAAIERKNAAQSRANLIRGLLQAGQPIEGVEDVRSSVVIQQLSQSLANLQGELAQRSSTLLPNHPTIKALRAQIRELEGQIALEGRRVADALEAEAKIEADLAASLNDELARSRLTVSDDTRQTVELAALEREAKAQRDLLESYLLRYSDAVSRTEVSSALPDVRVVTIAAPATKPSSPRTGLILGAVAFVAFTLQVGGIVLAELTSGRVLVPRRIDPSTELGPEFEAMEEIEEIEAIVASEGEGAAQGAEAEDSEARLDDRGEAGETLPLMAAEMEIEPFTQLKPSDAAKAEAAAEEGSLDAEGLDFADLPEEDVSVPYENALTLAETASDRLAVAQHDPSRDDDELTNLSADLALGRVRVVMLAALDSFRDCQAVSDRLVADALRRGLSVATIDAGSGRLSVEPGLTDLSTEDASFGDVVHKVRDGLAEVPWGQQATLQRRSSRLVTLLEALADIYEVVLVSTGRIGMSSTLPVFAGIDCRLVLVQGAKSEPGALEAAVEDAAALGFEVAQVVAASRKRSEVA